MAQIPRLFLDHDMGEGKTLSLDRDAAHYLFGVMRLRVGAAVDIFNGRDGTWRAEVLEAGKRAGTLRCVMHAEPQSAPPDLWMVFAPVKKTQTDFIVEKSVEMGAARLIPVQTEFTNAERIRREKMEARVREAAEQCGANYLPEVADLTKLGALLDHWPAERRLLFADEGARGGALAGLKEQAPGPWAILIGPEGGFSEDERARLRALPFTVPTSLGPRILRAETAAVAALALWQIHLGDWR
ncbi:16S rRNA (uracil(1498)-N(3))-methyltransferase [Roseobacteraceae bacterium S113]